MWPDFVVLLSPARYLDPRIEEVAKPVGSQALIAQLAVKALHMTVLRRATGLDVSELDLPLQSPGQKMPTGQFWAVVAANRLWQTTSGDDFIEHAGHATAGKAGVHFERKTLAREGINDAQYPDRASSSDRIVREVQCPLLVGASQLQTRRPNTGAVFTLLTLQTKPGLAVHPIQPLVVHSLAFTLDQHL